MDSRGTTVQTVIFVAPHPDDIELGCGGTIAYLRSRGFRAVCVYLSSGGHTGKPAVREREARAACKALRVPSSDVLFGRFPDTKIPESFEVIDYLESVYSVRSRSRALTVMPASDYLDLNCMPRRRSLFAAFIPTGEDPHQDHRSVFHSARSAFRNVPRVYAYETPSALSTFSPTMFVDISRFCKRK